MGTSSAFGGASGTTPLVPSWLDGDDEETDGPVPPDEPSDDQEPDAPARPPFPPPGDPARFTAARGNFSRFAKSGGADGASLGRAISQYVGTASGGAAGAASHMGSSRRAGSRLLGFLGDAVRNGAAAALQALNLPALAGRPIEEIFLGLVDYICPQGGSIDEGIAREAFIETIADLAQAGVTDLDGLTADQMQTVFELFITNAIEARLCNDIGLNAVTLPADPQEAAQVQAQLHDFLLRGVADALTVSRITVQAMTADRAASLVDRVYQEAFGILQSMGDAAEEAA
jgi:hypothetical protein